MRVFDLAKQLDAALHPVLRRTLYALDRVESPILHKYELLRAVGHAVVMHDRWIRKPADYWPDPGKKEQGQLNAFLRHLFCAYRVPLPFNWAWVNDDGTIFCTGGRQWYAHLGAGGSLRDAPNLPYPLSRAAAHAVMHARDDLTLPQAMRYGQFVAMGVTEPLALAAVDDAASAAATPATPLRPSIARWLVNNRGRAAPRDVQQIVDYVIGRRVGNEYFPPQPDFHLGDRMPPQVMRDIRQWHAELNRARSMPAALAWASCGIAGFEQVVMDETGERRAVARRRADEPAGARRGGAGDAPLRRVVRPQRRAGECAIFALRRGGRPGHRRRRGEARRDDRGRAAGAADRADQCRV